MKLIVPKLLVSIGLLASCSYMEKKGDVSEPFNGIWKQSDISCKGEKYTESGKVTHEALKSGDSIVLVRISGDRAVIDIKSPSTPKAGFCRIVVREKWSFSANGELSVSDTHGVSYGFGASKCDNEYSIPQVRIAKYDLDKDTLRTSSSATHVASSAKFDEGKPACIDGTETLIFHKIL